MVEQGLLGCDEIEADWMEGIRLGRKCWKERLAWGRLYVSRHVTRGLRAAGGAGGRREAQ